MTPSYSQQQELIELAETAMRERGLWPDFSSAAEEQTAAMEHPGEPHGGEVRDLRDLLWCSIDNDDSRDLDQITVSESLPDGAVRILGGIADVDALVRQGTPVDQHAAHNTTSVYTSAIIFPMLPEKLSTGLTSLNPQEDRLAMVTDMMFQPDGTLASATVYRAWVHNHAQLAYDAVSDWIVGKGPLPEAAAAVSGMDAQLRTQDAVAQQLRARRIDNGALEFQTFQPKAVFQDGKLVKITEQEQNRARQLIQEFMIATNGVAARFLAQQGRSSLRRVVRSPERWQRIVTEAARLGTELPPEPDGPALEAFLAQQRRRDPDRFPDLSLTIIKLMGAGEYALETPGGNSTGHFGLAVRDYSHSTAPNRRFPDLVTARLLKAALKDQAAPYSDDELARLAEHCTRQEDAANKVERQIHKSEAALILEAHIGKEFDGIITGVSKGNNWVRIFLPPAEGKLHVRRGDSVHVGKRVRVKLLATDVERGHIDFELLS